nr:hypothetical protein [Saprospiraceae bacterium]
DPDRRQILQRPLVLQNPDEKVVILRHDVDLNPNNSMSFAKLQSDMGIKGSYYFRAVPESWDEDIIRNICSLGHEIGYHYENMDTASSKFKVESSKLVSGSSKYDQLLYRAYQDFCEHLEKLRQLVPVTTICMHGSPRSKFDNKTIWDKYDYRGLGILGEPYFDVDFNKVFYLTDTGRRWDGWKVSVRDKVPQQIEWKQKGLVFRSSNEIIAAIEQDRFPGKAMITFHPQRWHNKTVPWIKECAFQSGKNLVKRALISWRK